MRNLSRKIIQSWPWLAAVLSGLLCTACFAPFDQSWLCWIGLTPLICAVWFSGLNSRAPLVAQPSTRLPRRNYLLLQAHSAGWVRSELYLKTLGCAVYPCSSRLISPFISRSGLGSSAWSSPAVFSVPSATSQPHSWQQARGLRKNGFAAGSSAGSAGTDSASRCMLIGH